MLISSVKKITHISLKFPVDLVRIQHHQHFKFEAPKLVQIPVIGNILFKTCHTSDLSHSLITKINFKKIKINIDCLTMTFNLQPIQKEKRGGGGAIISIIHPCFSNQVAFHYLHFLCWVFGSIIYNLFCYNNNILKK